MRPDSQLRSQITADSSAGFLPEAGRYHLFIANNCPWQVCLKIVSSLKSRREAVTLLSAPEALIMLHMFALSMPELRDSFQDICVTWSRCQLTRGMLGLEDAISMDVSFP